MKKLHRSVADRKIAGVCGGLGEWAEADLVYLVMWMAIPRARAAA